MNQKWINIIKLTRVLYLITILLLGVCISLNIYALLHPHFRNHFFTIVISITPFVVIVYLLLIFFRKRKLSKKLHEQRQKFFSEN